VLGPPLSASALAHEQMPKPVAPAILSSDALSSVAYGPEAMLAVLALAGSAARVLSLEVREGRQVDMAGDDRSASVALA
jgi:hypothetical protein